MMPSDHQAEGFSASESSSDLEFENQLRDQWIENTETWIQKEQSVRTGFLDAWMLRALGDVEGRRVLDIGCGEGRFCRLLAGLGAEVTGIDLTKGLVERARSLSEGAGTYLVGNAHDLAGVEDERFDRAVSYIVMVDLFNYRDAIRSAFRVLRPGGRFIVCNIHPMRMAKTNGWIRQGNRKLFYAVDDYTDEGPRLEEISWTGKAFTSMHRTLSSYVTAFLESGFVLEGLQEPTPSAAQLAAHPTFDDEYRVPNFILYTLRKP
ncbi:MAG: class I SAM-dependent methyltransferase [Gemmatimonadota bacterium]|nr:class I SAM-dependent methyltransferase [Gemmatimonadota bacterium]